MTPSGIAISDLFSALLHRLPSDWEADYWSSEQDSAGFESVFRRITDCDEHKRFASDNKKMFVPAGHFYSPVVDDSFVLEREDKIFSLRKELYGIDLHEQSQVAFVKHVAAAASILPFQEKPKAGLRYHYDNGAFVYGDAVVYAAMIMAHKPKRILEIGSGFSSALALDTCDLMPGYAPEISFIDPYPQLVKTLVASTASPNITIREAFIQDVDPAELANLEAGDFYFMDTTHIVKTGSDVIYHFEEVLPRLKSGVIIHLHDIFYPLEYPKSWVIDDKLSWNEIYYFRAFIANNPDYEIMFWNNFMFREHFREMSGASKTFAKNGGASIWFRKR